jgi:hypothetical protein
MERKCYLRVVGAKTKRVLYCAASICGMYLLVVVAQAQQTPGLTQIPPQTAQPGQAAALQQNSQRQAESAQQNALDATRRTQQTLNQDQTLNGQPDQFNQQPRQSGQGMTQPGREPSGTSAGQRGEPGGAGQRGELGVYVIESAGPGVRVGRVATGSAAEAAGLRSGDILMEINGQTVDQPQEVIRLIRTIAAGELANLRIWRNGQEQQLAATLQPMRMRDGYESSFSSGSNSMNGDLAQRTQRLEQQLSMVMQELQRLRQEVMQLRGGGEGLDATGFEGQQPQSTPQPNADPFGQNATPPGLDKPTGQPAATNPERSLF